MNAIDEAIEKQTNQLGLYQQGKLTEIECIINCELIWKKALAKLIQAKSIRNNE